ncbi:MAG: hypothetical protein U0841_30980 [Chloroflexia bacterium]
MQDIHLRVLRDCRKYKHNLSLPGITAIDLSLFLDTEAADTLMRYQCRSSSARSSRRRSSR